MTRYLRIRPPSYLNIANLISLTRLILLPAYFYFLIYYLRWQKGDAVVGVTMVYYVVTVCLVPVILLTDILDGWVARKFELVNPLGAFLDPLADKFFAFFTMVALAWVEQIPVWLAMLVFFKEMFILIGWILLFILGYDTEISPSKLGKAAVVCQATVVSAALLTLPGGELFSWQAFPLHELAELLNRSWAYFLTAVVTSLAGIQYILEGLRRSHRIEPSEEKKLTVIETETSPSNPLKKP